MSPTTPEATRTDLRTPPFEFSDADGRRVRIDRASGADADALDRMYAAFSQTDRAQGLPPGRPEARREWIERLCAASGAVTTAPCSTPTPPASNVVARRDGRVVGHAALLGAADDRELAVFVAPDARGVGIGTALLRGALGAYEGAGGGRVWLSVEPSNAAARALYRRFGFDLVERGRFEMTMEREV